MDDLSEPFRFSFLPAVTSKLESIAAIAVSQKLNQELAADLKFIQERLTTDPTDWGDPLFDYKAMKMTRYRGTSIFFYIYYSVRIAEKMVVVQNVDLNPYGPITSI